MRILVDPAMAAAWTGRPTSTLRRWTMEQRITRHGTRRHALYDLNELPERTQHDTPPRKATT